MLAKLFTYLKRESELIDELITLAGKQQRALVNFDAGMLEEVTSFQEALANNLHSTENQRIKYLTSTLNITTSEAISLKLSSLEKNAVSEEELEQLRSIRNEMQQKLEIYHELNITNRMLTNRSMSNIREMIALFTSGGRRVCNVTV